MKKDEVKGMGSQGFAEAIIARGVSYGERYMAGTSTLKWEFDGTVDCCARMKEALNRALHLVRQALDEGRAAIRGVHTASPAPSSLEQAFSDLLSEATTGRGRRTRIFVQGEPRTLNPEIQEQLFLIGREALMNALRHSDATTIEIEVQYHRDFLCVVVGDNGRGINPDAVQKESDLHGGLRGMRDRAEDIGARFGIWSRKGAGTEVRVDVPVTSREGVLKTV